MDKIIFSAATLRALDQLRKAIHLTHGQRLRLSDSADLRQLFTYTSPGVAANYAFLINGLSDGERQALAQQGITLAP